MHKIFLFRLLGILFSFSLIFLCFASLGAVQTRAKKNAARSAEKATSVASPEVSSQAKAFKKITPPLSLHWTFNTQGNLVSSPLVVDDMVFFGGEDEKTYALNVDDGRKIWECAIEGKIHAAPFAMGGKVFLGTSQGKFYALDLKKGKILWTYETQDKIMGAANGWEEKGKKLVLVGSYDTYLYCWDAETGALQWQYETGNPIHGGISIFEEKAIFGGCDSHLHIVQIQEGKPIAKIPLGAYIAARPALYEENAFLGHYGGNFFSFDLKQHKIVWIYKNANSKASFLSTPSVDKNYVLAGCRDGSLYAFSRTTGEKLWSFRTGGEIETSSVLEEDQVFFGGSDGRLYIVRLSDGQKLWSYEIGPAITTSLVISAGKVIFGCEDGNLYAFGAAWKG